MKSVMLYVRHNIQKGNLGLNMNIFKTIVRLPQTKYESIVMNCFFIDSQKIIRSAYRRSVTVVLIVTTMLLFLVGCNSDDGNRTYNDQISNNNSSTTSAASTAVLSWVSPTNSVDNSCADEIVGYQVNYGNNSGEYTFSTTANISLGEVVCEQIDYDTTCNVSVTSCSYTLENLGLGKWYFAVQAYDRNGKLSSYSNEASKEIVN